MRLRAAHDRPVVALRITKTTRCVLGAALGLAATSACTPSGEAVVAAPRTEARPRPVSLRTRTVGEGNDLVVVLLHGYGASGDDLVPFARSLDAPPGTRFVMPEAPIDAAGIVGGRAWWPLDVAGLRAARERRGWRAMARARPEGVDVARESVVALVRELERPGGAGRARRVVLAGFSQGAMLAGDVAFESDVPLAGVALLSGTPVASDAWTRGFSRRAGLPVLVTHGRADPLLPFEAAEDLSERLGARGPVTWVPFDGGHTIAPAARTALETFLRELAAGR